MFELVKKVSSSAKWFSGSSRSLRVIATVVGAILIAAILFWAFNEIFYYYFAKSYVEEISAALGLNRHLSSALVWLLFGLIVFFAGSLFSFSKRKRLVGMAFLIALMIGQPLVLYWFDKPFDTNGVAQKCYVVTRETVRYGGRPGIDPSTGLECKPVTPEIAELLERYEKGERAQRIPSDADPVFFSPATGQPIVWYTRTSTGLIELFNLMGYHPQTSEPLVPVTKEIVALWKVQRKAAKRIYPDDNYAFFDPATGKPNAWYLKKDEGSLEFYDGPGFDGRTGEPLLQVSQATISEWKKYRAEHRGTPCYILTKDSVRYGNVPGIDPETGRQCRPYTPDMLERLREYERGNRPRKVETASPAFFDLRSGEPAVWFGKNRSGDIELFSLMGFHPDTGEELLPITNEVAAAWTAQQAKPKRAPQKVDPAKFVFFDPISGEPRAWYWHGPEGQWEFYDGPGFHPYTGDALQILTKDLVLKFQKQAAEIEKKRIEDAANATHAADTAAKNRIDQLQKLSQFEKQCDLLAANPNDQRRVGEGVSFDVLKTQAKEAVEACDLAVQQNSNEPRLQYQLARALAHTDRKRAFSILQKLVAARYPAAFDNIGWYYYFDLKNPQAAINYFRAGVDLDDSDSMLSLGEMISRNLYMPRGPSETKLALYHRAAQLGNAAGARAENEELEKQGAEVANQELQLEQAKIAGQVFNVILQGMARR